MDSMFAQTRFSLAGRVALATGAGAGIGKATAHLTSQAGAIVGLHFRTSRDGAESLAEAIRERGGKALLLQGDLANESEAQRVVDQLVENTGRLDVVFNNAGAPLARSSIEDCPTEIWRQAFDVKPVDLSGSNSHIVGHYDLGGGGRNGWIGMYLLRSRPGREEPGRGLAAAGRLCRVFPYRCRDLRRFHLDRKRVKLFPVSNSASELLQLAPPQPEFLVPIAAATPLTRQQRLARPWRGPRLTRAFCCENGKSSQPLKSSRKRLSTRLSEM